jgi:hypothetical protein
MKNAVNKLILTGCPKLEAPCAVLDLGPRARKPLLYRVS